MRVSDKVITAELNERCRHLTADLRHCGSQTSWVASKDGVLEAYCVWHKPEPSWPAAISIWGSIIGYYPPESPEPTLQERSN